MACAILLQYDDKIVGRSPAGAARSHEDLSVDEKIEAAKVAADAGTAVSAVGSPPPKTVVKAKTSSTRASTPKTTAPKTCGAGEAETPQHHLAQMRHDPAAIRRVFETGEYPY